MRLSGVRMRVGIRRLRLGPVSATATAALVLAIAATLVILILPIVPWKLPLAYGASSGSLKSLSERILDDVPLMGTGAGTFPSLAPIYKEMEDPAPGLALRPQPRPSRSSWSANAG